MRNFTRALALLFVGALAIGGQACGGSDSSSNSGGSGGSDSGGKGGSDSGGKGGAAGGGGSSSGSGGSGGGSSGGGVTFEKDAKPIFAAKCSPCHTDKGIAKIFHTMASLYVSVNKDAAVCTGKKKGECALVRIKDGSMPQSANCTGDPTKDAANDKCLTKEQQDTLQAWIDGGMLEK